MSEQRAASSRLSNCFAPARSVEHPEVLVELGAIILGLSVLSRLATRIGMPTIPLYLTAGLAFGKGGILPLVTAEEFVQIGAEIGLILLLLMLGLEYTAAELTSTLRGQARVGGIDFLLNFTPGFAAGVLLGWGIVLAVVLGGVTYVSSSGIVAKVLSDQGWTGNRETPVVLSALVIEDLVMALYLPIAAALLVGKGDIKSLAPAILGVAIVALVLGAATKIEVGVSRLLFSRSDESLLLTILGMTIFIAGAAEVFGLSAAVAALLVGIVLSGPAAEAAHGLLSPMRDLFAAIFLCVRGPLSGPIVDPSGPAASHHFGDRHFGHEIRHRMDRRCPLWREGAWTDARRCPADGARGILYRHRRPRDGSRGRRRLRGTCNQLRIRVGDRWSDIRSLCGRHRRVFGSAGGSARGATPLSQSKDLGTANPRDVRVVVPGPALDVGELRAQPTDPRHPPHRPRLPAQADARDARCCTRR